MAMQASQKSKFFPNIFWPRPPTTAHIRFCFLKFYVRVATVFLLSLCVSHETKADALSINDAISQAVHTNPGVGEASANRRATETQLYQTQGAYLPQVRLESSLGPEKFNQQIVPPPLGNGDWLNGKQASVVVRQILFDGFASIHEIWRQSARVNAAAFRVRERTELTALDAAEAYIDVVRFLRLVALANQNIANHEELFSNVKSRFEGGRAGEGDLQQALERVEAAKAAREEFRRSLEDARAKYRKVIGLEAINLRFPGPLRALPQSKNEALTVALHYNPTLLAAESDREAARQAFHATAGAFVPNVSLVGRASRGIDADTFIGKRDDVSGKVVISWDIFRGGQDAWHRVETAERYTEETLRHARLQRDALEMIDKAWAARTITADRIAALQRQLVAEKKTIAIYRNEYEIGRRSLIDLLNAQNQYFNAAVSLTSARGVVVFADYQLLAAMGSLLDYLKTAPPVEAAPLDRIPLGILPIKLPPIILSLRQPGIDLLDANGSPVTFEQRWAATSDQKPGAPLASSPTIGMQGQEAPAKEPSDSLALRTAFQAN
jgi:outer membrane protein, adhesin transport system